MKKRESNRKRLKERVEQIKVENRKEFLKTKRLEINGSSNTSLSFRFGKYSEYSPSLTIFKHSKYSKKALRFFYKWKSQNNWRKKPTKKRKERLVCVVANLITLPRTIKRREIRKPLSLKVTENRHLYEVIRFLRKNKYINFLPGFYFSGKNFATSKIYPTIKFDNIFPPFPDEYEANRHVTVLDSALIRIKSNYKPINLTKIDKIRTQGIYNKLIEINSENLSHKIMIRSSNREYPCNNKLCAVFKKNINRGGRLYASGFSWQNDTKENRSHIYIDDEPTIELGYSDLHLHMLYAKEGFPLINDPYNLGICMQGYHKDPNLRKLSKFGLFILINSTNKKDILETLGKTVWEEDRKLSKYLKKKYEWYWTEGGIYSHTVKALIDINGVIEKYFYSDIGSHLQNIEGKMAAWICYSFAKQGIPILPIHDSFIVQVRYEELLKETMKKSYAKYNNGYTCPIDYTHK